MISTESLVINYSSLLALDCLNKTESFLHKWVIDRTMVSDKAAEGK